MSTRNAPLDRIAQVCRTVTAGLLTPLLGRSHPGGVEHWLRTRPPHLRWTVIGATLAILFALALIMAQFGWLGLALYFAAIVALIR